MPGGAVQRKKRRKRQAKLHVSSRITVRVSAKTSLKPQWPVSEPRQEEKRELREPHLAAWVQSRVGPPPFIFGGGDPLLNLLWSLCGVGGRSGMLQGASMGPFLVQGHPCCQGQGLGAMQGTMAKGLRQRQEGCSLHGPSLPGGRGVFQVEIPVPATLTVGVLCSSGNIWVF